MRDHIPVSFGSNYEDTFISFEIQTWLPRFKIMDDFAWEVGVKVTHYYGNKRMISSLAIDKQLIIPISAWPKFGICANNATKIRNKATKNTGRYCTAAHVSSNYLSSRLVQLWIESYLTSPSISTNGYEIRWYIFLWCDFCYHISYT